MHTERERLVEYVSVLEGEAADAHEQSKVLLAGVGSVRDAMLQHDSEQLLIEIEARKEKVRNS